MTNEVKVWLDDNRPAPDGWTLVRSVEEAQALLKTGGVSALSLDYDLGFDQPTGYDLVLWMADTGHWPTLMIEVHSSHPIGRRRIIDAIRQFSPVNYGL